MLLTFDFHNHSCLSPCAQLENSPENIAARAGQQSIDICALTDHNSALNAPAFAVACARAGLLPLFGLEISPFEEAHLLAIFSDPLAALKFSDKLYRYLPKRGVNPLQFGDQVAVDPESIIISMPSVWFGNPLEKSFDFFARGAAAAGALVIPAHVDRPQFSVYSQLGFLPEGPYDAVEAVGSAPDVALCADYCVISGSDAHVLEHVGRRSSAIEIEDSGTEEALREGLARMLAAWKEAHARTAATAASDGPSDEGISSSIPDMAPLIEFMEQWYPCTESAEFLEEIRTALRAKKAWSVHRRPR